MTKKTAPLGRRNNFLGCPKAELVEVIERMTALGLGSTTIARLLGYDQSRIYQIRAEFGIKGVGRESDGVLRFIEHNLPTDLKAQCLRIRTRSDVARESATNKRLGVSARTVHHLVDEGDDSCVNNSGTVRPEKEAA